MIPPERVAAAEDAKRRVLATATETRFGTFVHDATHERRIAATQLLDAELPSHTGQSPSRQSPEWAGVAEDTTSKRCWNGSTHSTSDSGSTTAWSRVSVRRPSPGSRPH